MAPHATTERVDRETFRARLGYGPCGQLYQYWRSKIVFGRLPHRVDIDPLQVRSILDGMFIATWDPDAATYRFLIAGLGLPGLFDDEPRDRTLEEVLPALLGRDERPLYDVCLGSAVAFAGEFRRGGSGALLYRRLLLPVTANNRDLDTVLGMYEPADGIGFSHTLAELHAEPVTRVDLETRAG